MGTAERRTDSDLVERVRSHCAEFDFFRAVEVLEKHLNQVRRGSARYVGGDTRPGEVGLRFDVHPSLSFPPRALRSVEAVQGTGERDPSYKLVVAFLGLIGPAGTLPPHYTEMVIARAQEKDDTLRAFVNLLQERSVEFFYRAWKKYRMPVAFGTTRRADGQVDPILSSLLALVGVSPARSRPLGDDKLALVHHAGLFSDRRRSASALAAMLRGLLGCEVAIEQFVGEWVELDQGAWSRLGSGPGEGAQAQLGEVSVLGGRIWSVDARVRIVAGPLDRQQFRRLWPGGEPVGKLRQLVREFLGPLISFDLEWELEADAAEPVQLGGDQRLGRDSWLGWRAEQRPTTRVASPDWHSSPTLN